MRVTTAASLAAAALAVFYALARSTGIGFVPPIEAVAWVPPANLPIVESNARLAKATLAFEKQFLGPESMVSDYNTGFMYTGILDGRILGLDVDAETYWTAYRFNTSCPDTPGTAAYLDMAGPREALCGRPLGMRIDPRDGSLLVLESYKGLYRFPRLPLRKGDAMPEPELLSTGPSDGGRRLILANDLAVSSRTGLVYFTETQDRWGRYRIVFEYMSARSSGRLLEYNPHTRKTRVLADKLRMPNGISLSENESKVFFASWQSVYSYNIATGAITEVVGNLPGIPDNLRAHPTKPGHYILAMASLRAAPFSLPDFLAPYPRVRELIVALLPEKTAAWVFERFVKRCGLLLELNLESTPGKLVSTWQDRSGRILWLSEVHLHNKFIYIGSWHEPHLVKISLEDFLQE